MGLIQVATSTLTSSASTIPLNGIDSDNVYMLACNNLIPDSTNPSVFIRVNKSSSAQDDSEYDYVFKGLSSVGFAVRSDTDEDKSWFIDNINTYGGNAIAYLYNFNDASEYSFGTVESVANVSNQQAGYQGGFVHTVASASNGVTLYLSTGSFNSGTATLYKVI
tara:strand:+ start:555 stop:1046 length:492 start_codon:yes stop_codon:yes gene_type:complete